MICLVLPKIMSSTSCLMKFSNIFVFTLLSLIYFSLYYKRGKRKFQSSALMFLPKKISGFFMQVAISTLAFPLFSTYNKIEMMFEAEESDYGGFRHI